MPPEGADLVLPSNIPHGEGDVFVLDSLDIETWEVLAQMNERIGFALSFTNCRNGRNNFTEL